MDIQNARRYARETLATYCTDNESDYLLAYILSKDRAWLYAHSEYPLNHAQSTHLKKLVEKRKAGKPLAYLKGYQEFYGLSFYVDETVLIPRPETEIAVAYAIDSAPQHARLLDLGSGCGNIAIAIAYHRPDLQVTASDISVAALDIARNNAQQHHCRIDFVHSDWYQNINTDYDWIICNPPYIAYNDNDADYHSISCEPQRALYATNNGSGALKTVILGAEKHLSNAGILLLEHGYKQAVIVAQLMHTTGFRGIRHLKDIALHPRYTVAQIQR